MKKFLISVLMILTATVMIAVLPTEAEAAIYEDTIRLHILANSDSDEDQALKLDVRDLVMSEYGELFTGITNIEAAQSILEERLPEIEASVNDMLNEYGYTAKASLITEWYDTRYYEEFTLPKGYYRSLKIEIGCGEGQNWWCVMYPPMCLGMSTANTGSYTSREKGLIIGKYEVKFKLLELISELG